MDPPIWDNEEAEDVRRLDMTALSARETTHRIPPPGSTATAAPSKIATSSSKNGPAPFRTLLNHRSLARPSSAPTAAQPSATLAPPGLTRYVNSTPTSTCVTYHDHCHKSTFPNQDSSCVYNAMFLAIIASKPDSPASAAGSNASMDSWAGSQEKQDRGGREQEERSENVESRAHRRVVQADAAGASRWRVTAELTRKR